MDQILDVKNVKRKGEADCSHYYQEQSVRKAWQNIYHQEYMWKNSIPVQSRWRV